MITIYTDGSSRGNPGPGGWGVVLAHDKRVVEIGGYEPHTTNNRMELTACIRALQFSISNFQFSKITIYTDSKYVMLGITEWIHNWVKRGWRTAGKKSVLNQDLWQELLTTVDDMKIEWKYVEGHAGHKHNERADIIATHFADRIPIDLYDGSRSEYK